MRRLTMFVLVAGLILLAAPAQAQLNGSHVPGDYGVQSGSQPAPGFYAALFYLRYDTDTIKDADGNIVCLAPSAPGSIGVAAVAPLAWYVTKTKVLGANYGAMVVLPFANASIEAPAFALGETVETSVSDLLLLRPLDLGWHPRARTSPPAFSSMRRQGGTSAAAATTSEPACGRTSHSWGRRSTSTRCGPSVWPRPPTPPPAQWKLTEDRLAEFVLPGGGEHVVNFPGKHRVYGFGPDVTLPVATKSKLFALVNLRYLWETGAQLKTEGQTLVVTATFPVPSARLN